ncbi:MAG: hypothetical protein DMG63_02445 [Acidobacteria bacterium]|nr:MAG: hypothetical protein DMG63_02445 [Acidobacteriota bacterium]
MFTPRPIGFVLSPYKKTSEVPKGPGAKHDADGVLKILPEFEPGLNDIEGFSHLFVLWEFDRSTDFELFAAPPFDDRPHKHDKSSSSPTDVAQGPIFIVWRASQRCHQPPQEMSAPRVG